MSKTGSVVLGILIGVVCMAGFSYLSQGEKVLETSESIESISEEQTSAEKELSVLNTLNESLKLSLGDYTLRVEDDLLMRVESVRTVLGVEGMSNIVIDGKGTGSITAVGAKKSVVTAALGCKLTFKNLTINDNTNPEEGVNVYNDYLWLGGELRFENCIFTDSIYLKEASKVTFVDCEFNSTAENYYSVWIGSGETEFERCKFKGYRGIKIHEFDETEDVKAVRVENCLFDNLSAKPGLAIGTVNESTEIRIVNNTFDGCAAWDTEGSLVGVDGIYECDTPRFEFTFEERGNIASGR